MKLGLQLPYLSAGVDREAIIAWCQRAEAGPFDTLQVGDRMTYRNLDQFSVLAAASVLTESVRIMTSITILPAHPVALIAKRAATLDVLSEGRFVLGVSVGGRVHDFQAAEKEMKNRHQRLDDQVIQLKRMWAGEPPFAGAEPVGPPPVQPGGPPIFTGSVGPKALARAAKWADGFCGGAAGPAKEPLIARARQLRQAWEDAGRDTAPYLVAGASFALGDGGKQQLRTFWADYMRIMGPAIPDAMLDAMAVITDASTLLATIDAAESAGWDELHLGTVTHDVAELDRLEAALAKR